MTPGVTSQVQRSLPTQVLGFSQLYMVTILRRRQEERNATRFKML